MKIPSQGAPLRTVGDGTEIYETLKKEMAPACQEPIFEGLASE